ncbi:Pimeloyl-ACP methyl ester carboxylesterase [Pedobacter westerhofensis]|uniref:Pimeloyl-ACP methyl ester carboxylesterase n=1 Tax=Pedobacter westerhofensis TaxID=425512 RepID=A0A521AV43_9SPHI|nr:alpha/beta hydrolase [Pedobacter westerhofensis]SMO38591.1 Pimeloyl-ACP methyl ester carboxylesterase [Pedobacter westerhofensis]
MKTMKFYSVLLIALIVAFSSHAQSAASEKPAIIFVHGIWADGTSWTDQITGLQAKGYPVISVQNPVTSLAADVAATQRAIDMAKGKVILVGHSWGGFVITQAGNDPKVIGLVYVAAYAPEIGETVPELQKNAPGTELSKYFVPAGDFVYLSEAGVKAAFANDLPVKERKVIYATQTPASKTVFGDKSGTPAWKQKPSWYIVAKGDKTINPDLERFMAKRIKAKTTELESGHVVMIAQPKAVLRIIEEAASAKN